MTCCRPCTAQVGSAASRRASFTTATRAVADEPLSVLLAGADFTNTFRCLSQVSCPTEGGGEEEEEQVRKATELLLEQCATLEELKVANKTTMDPR